MELILIAIAATGVIISIYGKYAYETMRTQKASLPAGRESFRLQ